MPQPRRRQSRLKGGKGEELIGLSRAEQSQRCTRATKSFEDHEVLPPAASLAIPKAGRARSSKRECDRPAQDGRTFIELINAPMLYQHKATPAAYKAGLDLAVERGWLELYESGTFVRFTQSGKDLFA